MDPFVNLTGFYFFKDKESSESIVERVRITIDLDDVKAYFQVRHPFHSTWNCTRVVLQSGYDMDIDIGYSEFKQLHNTWKKEKKKLNLLVIKN